MQDQAYDFYQKLRSKIRDWLYTKEGKSSKWSEYLMLAPDLFHLLCKLSTDTDVPVREKAKLAAAIAYFVSPIDVLPEAIAGPLGYLDDIAIAAYVLHSIIKNTSPEVVLKYWAGEKDALDTISQILKVADENLGRGVWKRLKKLIDTQGDNKTGGGK